MPEVNTMLTTRAPGALPRLLSVLPSLALLLLVAAPALAVSNGS